MKFLCVVTVLLAVASRAIGTDSPTTPLTLAKWKDELTHAVSTNDLDAAKFLIEHYIPYQQHIADLELLHLAADDESMGKDFVEYLLRYGAKLDAKDNKLGFAPISRAIRSGNYKVAYLLIEKGVNVNTKSFTKVTPLHLAVRAGNAKLVKLLLEKGAKVNAVNKNGNSPLHIAIVKSNVSLAKILIDNGANVNLENSKFFKQRPLHTIAAIGPKSGVKLVELLVKNGADINAKDSLKRTPLDTAIHYDHEDIADILRRADEDQYYSLHK